MSSVREKMHQQIKPLQLAMPAHFSKTPVDKNAAKEILFNSLAFVSEGGLHLPLQCAL
jgi:hypothetical protein